VAPQVATLGVGTFSRVKLVKHRGTGKTYALKIMRQKKIEQVPYVRRPRPPRDLWVHRALHSARVHVGVVASVLRPRTAGNPRAPATGCNLAAGNPRAPAACCGGANTPGCVQMKQTTHIMNEKRIMLEMDHPFIIQLMATGSNKACLFMVTELVQGGELFSVLTREEVLDEAQTRFYAGCIVLAIEALHEKNNIYRDLKPENILLDNEGYAKLCDFGFAKKIEGERTHTTCGTPEYVSPEMLQPDGHGKATDYWCIGIFVYECLCATTPFAADNYMDTYEQIQKYAVAGPTALPWQSDVTLSAGAKALIAGFLHPNVNKRLGCRSGGPREIREHIWFKGFNWDDLYHKRMPTKATPGVAGYVPFVPTVKGDDDYSNFETDEYGDDSDAEEYRGDGSWFAEF
jgi:serine/threonine protein kinase